MVNSSLFRRIELQMLMNLTAKAIGEQPKRIWTYPNREALRIYAEYTSSHLRDGADEALIERMNHAALLMGQRLRHWLFIRSEATARRFIIALYRNIGIELSFTDAQHLCFHRCLFSRYYTPAACLAASALDDGIIRGLTGRPACRLCFSQRLTEGGRCCMATFQETNQKQDIYEESHRNR